MSSSLSYNSRNQSETLQRWFLWLRQEARKRTRGHHCKFPAKNAEFNIIMSKQKTDTSWRTCEVKNIRTLKSKEKLSNFSHSIREKRMFLEFKGRRRFSGVPSVTKGTEETTDTLREEEECSGWESLCIDFLFVTAHCDNVKNWESLLHIGQCPLRVIANLQETQRRVYHGLINKILQRIRNEHWIAPGLGEVPFFL